MDRALEIALRVAPTDLSVLITGESGVGKEFFPQVIHAYSIRKHNKYIAVNCGAIPEGTIDSELFGHEKGSFTGAAEARKGYFEEANGGTIFLDEVAELPLSTQVRLLRVLQAGEFMRVGSSKLQKTDVRVIAATNINLQAAIDEERFRMDLYYRLNTVPIHVPPLRERKGDIPLLFRKFASDVGVQYRMPAITLTDDAREMLSDYYWRGNIRQLKNVAEQISAIEETRTITPAILAKYLPDDGSHVRMPVLLGRRQGSTAGSGGQTDNPFERELMYKVLMDLRTQLAEMKDMLQEALESKAAGEKIEKQIVGLLHQSNPQYGPAMEDVAPAEEYVDPEDNGVQPTGGVRTKEQVIREETLRALRRHNGKRKEAARDLLISERTLYRRIKDLGINEY